MQPLVSEQQLQLPWVYLELGRGLFSWTEHRRVNALTDVCLACKKMRRALLKQGLATRHRGRARDQAGASP